MTIRERVVDAAIEVLGTLGIHALSHARVDLVARTPTGSASNYFRTRAALVAGAVERLREKDRAAWEQTVPPADADQLVAGLAAFVEAMTGPERTRTVARYVIFVQGVVEPDLLEPLNADRRLIVEWAAEALTRFGHRRPRETAEMLLAHVEGLVLHRLSGFSTAPPEESLRRLIG